MRFYNIEIRQPGSNTIFRQYTSFPKAGNSNQNDPGALNVIIDAFVLHYDAAGQYSHVQIQGIGLSDISQAANYQGLQIKVYGGFTKGLPLNNPNQAGLLVEGIVFQCFGNWVGTSMTLDFVIAVQGLPGSGGPPIPFSWKAGTPLSQAITAALNASFPGVPAAVNISDKLVLPNDENGYYPDLQSFSEMVRAVSRGILGGNYGGVVIAHPPGVGFSVADSPGTPATPSAPAFVFNGTTYPIAADGTITVPSAVFSDPSFTGFQGATSNPNGTFTVQGVQPNNQPSPTATTASPGAPIATPPIQVAFQDLIGQPTWFALNQLTFICPMRADIAAQAIVQMPKGLFGNPNNPNGAPGLVTTTSASMPNAKQSSTFTGKFFIQNAHHVGNFRQPDGFSWCTIYQATVYQQ